MRDYRSFEGQHVSVAVRDGSRIDDCVLLAAGRHRTRSLWLFVDGEDRFLPLDDVLEVWELTPGGCCAA